MFDELIQFVCLWSRLISRSQLVVCFPLSQDLRLSELIVLTKTALQLVNTDLVYD